MSTSDGAEIVKRFFLALDQLIELRVLRGKKTFTDRYGINRWNFNTVQKQPAGGMFKTIWLTHLVLDFGVSAHWLLTGEGEMLGKKKQRTGRGFRKVQSSDIPRLTEELLGTSDR